MIKTLAAVAFIGLNFYTYHFLATDPVFPERRSFAEFPLELEEWVCPGLIEMDANTRANLGVTDYLTCRFRKPDSNIGVDVYVGYHASQVREEGGGAGENSIHPPAHCLPGSGWDIVDNKTVKLELDGWQHSGETVKRMVIAKGQARQLVYYWYQSRGRVLSQDWKKIVYVGLDRAMKNRTDGSLIRFTVPILQNNEAGADAIFRDLAPHILNDIAAYVPE